MSFTSNIKNLTLSKTLYDKNNESSIILNYSIFSRDFDLKTDKKYLILQEGQLKCQKQLEKNIYLFSDPLKLKEGNYTLIKSGDWNGSLNFTIGHYIPPFYAPDIWIGYH